MSVFAGSADLATAQRGAWRKNTGRTAGTDDGLLIVNGYLCVQPQGIVVKEYPRHNKLRGKLSTGAFIKFM